MPVHRLELALSLGTNGVRGGFFQTGNPEEGTSVGQKQSGWNFLPGPHSRKDPSEGFKSLEITQVLLKAGGQGAAATPRPTACSKEFTDYWKNTIQPSKPSTSIPNTTQQMDPPEASSLLSTSSFPQSNSQTKSNHLSSTLTPYPTPAKEMFLNVLLPHPKHPFPPLNTSDDNRRTTPPMIHSPTPHKRPRLFDTGGKSAFTQQAHGEFIVSSETKCPPNTQQAHGEYF